MTSADGLSLILRRLDEIERKLDRIMEELRTPTPSAIRRGVAIFQRRTDSPNEQIFGVKQQVRAWDLSDQEAEKSYRQRGAIPLGASQFGETRLRGSALPVVYRPFGGRVERKLNMSCLYSTACVYGVTALTVAIWSIPLLLVVIWRLTKASIGTRDFVFLGLLGLIFLIQVVSSLISPNATMGLIYILAGAAK